MGEPGHLVAPPAPPAPVSRAAAFRAVLGAPGDGGAVDLRALRALAAGGAPEAARPAAWRLLLGVLPPERDAWAPALAAKRRQYHTFCAELLVGPPSAAPAAPPAAAAPLRRTPLSAAGGDHPLSRAPASAWAAHFRDGEALAQIERDVARTHPGLHFFSGAGAAPARRRLALARALFVFAKLNPGLTYVQGMNELMAVLLWQFDDDGFPGDGDGGEAGGGSGGGARGAAGEGGGGGDPPPPPLSELLSGASRAPRLPPPGPAEADAFFGFVALMAEHRDLFCAPLDGSPGGVAGALGALAAALRAADAPLAAHLEATNKVDPQFYAFRWIALALTQEFALPDVALLWDSLLAAPEGRRRGRLLALCVAMLVAARAPLLAGDFAANVKLLQAYPPGDVAPLLAAAAALAARVGDPLC